MTAPKGSFRKPSTGERSAITRQAREKAFNRKNIVRCRYCGKGLTKRNATGDHKHPISKGGPNTPKNIVMACGDCNSRKGSIPIGTYLQMIRKDGTYLCKLKGAAKARMHRNGS